jgi:hypothetical protein
VIEVAPGLRRWTSLHEEWREQVGSVAVETPDGLVLIDPIDPPEELARLDHVLLTLFFHVRSAPDLGGARLWASQSSARSLRNRGVEVTDVIREETELPGGMVAFPTARRPEAVFWLPQERALVVGDVLLGAGAKPRPTGEPLRLCPERWLQGRTHDDLRDSLRPLLELPVERVLVSHGEPVLEDGGEALAAALGG